MWTKKEAGVYTYKDYKVTQINGLGWCLVKGSEGQFRFKTLSDVKEWVAKQEVAV